MARITNYLYLLKQDKYKNMVDYCKSLKVGDKVKFEDFKQKFTVRARSANFIILTKPFNLKRTVLYTIIDIYQLIRGKDNMIFCNGYETDEQCEKALIRLDNGDMEVSSRNYVLLDVELNQ